MICISLLFFNILCHHVIQLMFLINVYIIFSFYLFKLGHVLPMIIKGYLKKMSSVEIQALLFVIYQFLDFDIKRFERPSLIRQIKNILQQYPDDSQIFKVQNFNSFLISLLYLQNHSSQKFWIKSLFLV